MPSTAYLLILLPRLLSYAHKARENELKQTIATKDRMYEQDAMVRMQLGKRLEQVFIDKEEALEQIRLLQEQLEAIKSTMR